MFDPTKPVMTRDGRKARIICTDRASVNAPLIALITNKDEIESMAAYTKDGFYSHFSMDTSPEDLINIPEKHVRYLNIYDQLRPEVLTSRKSADNYSGNVKRIACIRIEYENGQFDD